MVGVIPEISTCKFKLAILGDFPHNSLGSPLLWTKQAATRMRPPGPDLPKSDYSSRSLTRHPKRLPSYCQASSQDPLNLSGKRK